MLSDGLHAGAVSAVTLSVSFSETSSTRSERQGGEPTASPADCGARSLHSLRSSSLARESPDRAGDEHPATRRPGRLPDRDPLLALLPEQFVTLFQTELLAQLRRDRDLPLPRGLTEGS